MRGRFITIEGTEGVGKTTNIEYIKQWLDTNHISFVSTREPGGTPLAEEIRELLLANREEKVCSKAELLMMFAGRAQHIDQVIEPQLAAGNWVLCDRFTDATYAYQGAGREMGNELIASLETMVHASMRPDLTLVLDVPVELGLERAGKRSEPDRFELEKTDFFNRVRNAYLSMAEQNPQRYKIIDASKTLEFVQQQIAYTLNNFLTTDHNG
ncbi:MAG: dTMP kinase [Cellvibrionales bacterium TMED47]|nr:dTMP kinase [Porticoccaceae bacterium]RPG85202.1 MAG: dTMP kinase [Cellvibrionales bacterium TMED47]